MPLHQSYTLTQAKTKTPLYSSFFCLFVRSGRLFFPLRQGNLSETECICTEIIIPLFLLLLPGFPPLLTSLTHERSHASPHSRSGWDELAQMLDTYCPYCAKLAALPSVHDNLHEGFFSSSSPPQGCTRRWPCWPLSCVQMPITKRTWSSSRMSSARGAWDTSWRWGVH